MAMLSPTPKLFQATGSRRTSPPARSRVGSTVVDTLAGINEFSTTGTNNTLIGGSGADVLSSARPGWSTNTLIAGTGNNTLLSVGQADTLIGGSGADVLQSSGYNTFNKLVAGSGNNTLISSGICDTLMGGSGTDRWQRGGRAVKRASWLEHEHADRRN